MSNQQSPIGEPADPVAAAIESQGAEAGKSSDGTTTDASTTPSQPTPTGFDELWEGMTGEAPAKPDEDKPQDDTNQDENAPQGQDDEPATDDDEDPPQEGDDRKTEDEKPPQDDDRKTDAEIDERAKDPKWSRARIKNLEKEQQGYLSAFERLNEGFMQAGLDPAKALDELRTFKAARDGDANARKSLADRYGIKPEQAKPALTDRHRALLEEYGLTEDFADLIAPPPAPAKADEGKPPEAKAPQQQAPEAQPAQVPQAVQDDLAKIAGGVRESNQEQAQAILERARALMLEEISRVAEEHGVQPLPEKWPGLLRKAVGKATAELTKPKGDMTRRRAAMRPTPGGGQEATPRDALDEAFGFAL